MNALQPKYPAENRRRSSSNRQRRANQTIAREVSLKILANSILSVVAIVALVRLIPYQLKQEAKIQEVKREAQETQSRVSKLRENFNRNFDPAQSRKIMQELTPKVDPNQRRIFFIKS